MPEVQRRLITYCSNIHPGESWDETFAALKEYVPKVKERISPDAPFPIGLRLSARAARGLVAQGGGAFSAWLAAHDCFVPTINGFPHGAFHCRRVKESVYLPDWHSRERSEYTKLLADLLAQWLPEGVTGSISTVPIGFRATCCEKLQRERFLEVLQHLERLRQEKGVDIVLALEPEAGCLLETARDLVSYLERMDFPDPLRERIGICLDCCHHALQFEEPDRMLSLLAGKGIRIAKVQVSSALRLRHEQRELLSRFDEPRYLHQVVIRDGAGELTRYNDLPEALEWYQGRAQDEWRCHFHLPLFVEENEEFQTTRFFAEELLAGLDPRILLEVETYTWDVLPQELRLEGAARCIAREIRWLQERVHATHRRP